MIIGTAGHIDHGKSTLIAALTGQTMDRLAEERRRGITIDLNFAPLELAGGRIAGVVDVPGHEDFIRNMVAGASGIDVALLVIAADEGIMPQTLEHLVVLEQLGIQRGIAVLTKADLAEPAWLELVASEVTERFAASSVRFRDIVPVSARSGAGIDALREALTQMLEEVPPRPRDDLLRLPVDRAFSVPGIGTVVTGTCWSGSAEIGAEVLIMPSGQRGRVRSIESHGRALAAIEPGTRTAVGISGIDRAAAPRGAVVVSAAGGWEPVRAVDVELRLDRHARAAIARRTRVRVDLGTAEVIAWAAPRGPIEPGGTGLGRLALDRPIIARGGDRFVLRSFSPTGVIGGGTVLDPFPERRSPWPNELSASDPAVRLGALAARRRGGIPASALPLMLGLSPRAAEQLARSDSTLLRAGEHFVPLSIVEAAADRLRAALREFHQRQPGEPGMSLETLRRAVSGAGWITDAALARVRADGSVEINDSLARAPGFRPRVAGGDAIVVQVVAALAKAALRPPSLDELAATTGRKDVAGILRLAAVAGEVEALERDRYFARTALLEFEETLRELGTGEISVGMLRERLGLSRKFLIPLLEWSDARGITVRVGDMRRVRPRPSGPENAG